MTLKWGYAVAAVAVFAIEVLIALFVHDQVIRPHVGDVLAVILVYLALRAVTAWPVVPALVATLVFAVGLELGQLFHLLDALGLRDVALARVVLGGSFDVVDLACYGLGGGVILGAEMLRKQPLT